MQPVRRGVAEKAELRNVVLVKSPKYVIPANGGCPGMIEAGGIYKYLKTLDSAIKSRNDIHEKLNFTRATIND